MARWPSWITLTAMKKRYLLGIKEVFRQENGNGKTARCAVLIVCWLLGWEEYEMYINKTRGSSWDAIAVCGSGCMFGEDPIGGQLNWYYGHPRIRACWFISESSSIFGLWLLLAWPSWYSKASKLDNSTIIWQYCFKNHKKKPLVHYKACNKAR